MSDDSGKTREKPPVVEYEDSPPLPDLLNYRDMGIEMSRWPRTEMSCLSLLLSFALGLGCITLLVLLLTVLRGLS